MICLRRVCIYFASLLMPWLRPRGPEQTFRFCCHSNCQRRSKSKITECNWYQVIFTCSNDCVIKLEGNLFSSPWQLKCSVNDGRVEGIKKNNIVAQKYHYGPLAVMADKCFSTAVQMFRQNISQP